MNKKRLLIIIIYVLLVLAGSYYVFMGFQGLLTAMSKEGKVILPFVSPLLLFILLTGMFVISFHQVFHKEPITKKLYFRNSIYLIVNGSLASVFSLINVITYKNWAYGGPTILYPIDFLLLSLCGIAYGVYLLLLSKKAEDIEEKKENIVYKIARAIFAFIALDRLGCLLVSIFNGSARTFIFLVPLYILCLLPSLFFVIKVLKDKIESKGLIIMYSLIIGLWIVCNVYQIVMLFGNDATQFMKLISPFFGLDRIITIPVTFILLTIVTPIPFIIGLIKSIKDIVVLNK